MLRPLAAVLVFAAVAAQAQGRTLVITHANLIDGTRGAFASDASVVIRDGRIAEVVAGTYQAPAGAEVIDARGRYLLPGLIDAHAHVSNFAAARRALESGVTTIRSASTSNYQDVSLREAVRNGVIPGPDVLAAGVFVSPDLGESMLADPRLTKLGGRVTTEAAMREVVRVNLDHGVDVIKTRGTERAGLPNTDPRKQTYTTTELGWVVSEAATRNVPVMAHAHGDEGAYAAVQAGVRSIEHGTFLADSTLRLMKEKGTFFVPTYITVVDLTQPGGDYDDPVLTLRGRFMLPVLGETVRRASRLGVRIATGADTNYGEESLSRIAGEVASFVDLGLTPLEALRSATTTAADLLGIGARVGQIKPGFEADLILVEGNPLSDPRALGDVLVVVSNGRVALNRTPFAASR
ncbi:MAG: amidohydrolase family protein [Gemmatimonadaceae bacterium]|nr:amidohydrolase family protein [Gemmatimonadaceae bacterium]